MSIVHTPKDPFSVDLAAAIVDQIGVPFRENWCNPQECYGVGNSDTQVNVSPQPEFIGGRSYVFQDLLVPVRDETNLIIVDFDTLAFEVVLEEERERRHHHHHHQKRKKHCHQKKREKKWICRGVKAYQQVIFTRV